MQLPYISATVSRAHVAPQYPRIFGRGIPQKKGGRRKKTEVRCSSRDDAQRASGGPSAVAGLINRSRDRAWHRRRQRVVAPRGSSEGYQLLREETTKRREEEEREGGKRRMDMCVYVWRVGRRRRRNRVRVRKRERERDRREQDESSLLPR